MSRIVRQALRRALLCGMLRARGGLCVLIAKCVCVQDLRRHVKHTPFTGLEKSVALKAELLLERAC